MKEIFILVNCDICRTVKLKFKQNEKGDWVCILPDSTLTDFKDFYPNIVEDCQKELA